MPQSNTGFLDTSELDFLEIRESLKATLANTAVVSDFNYEGSNMAVVLDVLAWNTHLNSHYLNMIGSETFLDTARLQDSVYSHSKELNYLPRSRKSATAVVSITVTGNANSPTTLTMPENFSVESRYVDPNDGQEKIFSFITMDSVSAPKDAFNNYQFSELNVFEGRLVKEIVTFTPGQRSFVMASRDVDTESVRVTVTPNGTTTPLVFNSAKDTFGLSQTSQVFFIQPAYDGRFEVVFGDGNIGKLVSSGSQVDITYRSCNGTAPNGSSKFSAGSTVQGFQPSAIITETAAYGGLDRESVNDIRFNAPRLYTAQNRAVTEIDYKSMLSSQFGLQHITVYGGEKVTPKRYGQIIVCMKPSGAEIVSDLTKKRVVEFLVGKNITTEPVIVDADFLYPEIVVNAGFNSRLLQFTDEQVRNVVILKIDDFMTNVEGFGAELEYSRLVAAIDSSNQHMTSNDTKVRLVKRLRPRTGSTQPIKFSFQNKLKVSSRISNKVNNDQIVYSTPFKYLKNSVFYQVILADDGAGTMYLYSPQSNGSRLLIEESVGMVDYDTGEVNVSVNVFGFDKFIEVRAELEKRDVSVSENVFMSYDKSYLSVGVTRE